MNLAYDESYYWAYAIERNKQEEGYIQLFIRPRPWWIPESLWKRLLSKLLFLKLFNTK